MVPLVQGLHLVVLITLPVTDTMILHLMVTGKVHQAMLVAAAPPAVGHMVGHLPLHMEEEEGEETVITIHLHMDLHVVGEVMEVHLEGEEEVMEEVDMVANQIKCKALAQG